MAVPTPFKDEPSAENGWTVSTSTWYKSEIGTRLKPEIKEVFVGWAGVHESEPGEHLHRIRDQAWKSHKYPCIGQWFFLQSSLVRFAVLPQIIERLKRDSNRHLLDVGPGLGQDLRFLASRGVPTRQMYAMDVKDGLWEIGFDLFRDRDRFFAHFEVGDFVADEAARSRMENLGWEGKFDVILANQFFHLFSYTDQIKAVSLAVKLSRPGSTLIGFQRAQEQATEVIREWGTSFFHDATTFRTMWDQVQQDTGTRWTVEYEMIDCREWGFEAEDVEWMPPGAKMVRFTCTRDL